MTQNIKIRNVNFFILIFELSELLHKSQYTELQRLKRNEQMKRMQYNAEFYIQDLIKMWEKMQGG